MKKKNKVCFVFAVIFTVLTLLFAVVCVGGQVEIANMEYDESSNGDGMGEIGYLVGMTAFAFGLMFARIHLFFFSFVGVAASAVNFNCPSVSVRRISRIMLGFDGLCMAVSFVWLLYSIIIA